MLDLPKMIRMKGVGIFSSSEIEIEAEFDLLRQHKQTLIIVHEEVISDEFGIGFGDYEQWKLVGRLNDTRDIRCDELLLTKLNIGKMEQAEFTPIGALAIGNEFDTSVVEAHYPLIGFFEGKSRLRDDDWSVDIVDGHQEPKRTARMSKAYRIPMEGLVLRLTHNDATREQYEHKARQIMQLLSLACGNGVTCHMQIVSWGSEGNLEVWHQMPGDEFGPGQCVPGFRIESFLGQVLSSWSAWPEKKQSEARLAIIYINLSASGYLDTRMFQIMQGWEMLSNAWGHKVLLSGAEKNLKADIKSVYRQWRANHHKADPKGYLGSRLTSLFQWPPARRQMEALADSRGIDMARIGLDFERLKKARDKVAHSGKMPEDMLDKKNESLKLLKSAQYGLQLLLLAELGYSGLVVMEDKGWQSFVKIGEVLKSR